jgi:hypothetical protein
MIGDAPMMVVPLRTDEQGAIHIGQTRIPLELVIDAWKPLKALSLVIPA